MYHNGNPSSPENIVPSHHTAVYPSIYYGFESLPSVQMIGHEASFLHGISVTSAFIGPSAIVPFNVVIAGHQVLVIT